VPPPSVRTVLCEAIIPGEPVSKGRPRVGRGRAYTPKRTLEAEEAFGWALKQACPIPDDQHWLAVHVSFFCEKRWRRDGDNLFKLVLDSGNKIVWWDDYQVSEFHVQRIMGSDEPRTEIVVEIIGPMKSEEAASREKTAPSAAERTLPDSARNEDTTA
jgi:Holliday junction resolvase RusA-like endonuclease